MDFGENMDKEIEKLRNERKQINNEYRNCMKIYGDKIEKINNKIKELMKNAPKCYSCGRNSFDCWKAEKEDIDNYIDQNEGYSGPEIGEYYCGC